MADALASEPELSLQGLWAETGQVHALLQGPDGVPLLATVPVEAGLYAALSPHRPAAALFERAIADLWGHRAADAADTRPWLDWGHWPQLHPLSARPVPQSGQAEPPDFLPAQGDELHQTALGPIHGGITEPGHFRFTCAGETVVRLEVRLGYAHKGTLALMRGKPVRAAAQLAGRLSGDSTVAHTVAFSRAVEAALELDPPPRAHALRAVMAELERLANHLGDVGAICGDAASSLLHMRFGWRREAVLRASDAAFGHRLMMDCVLPGGTARDLTPPGAAAILRTLDALDTELPALARGYDESASLTDRMVGTGVMAPGQVFRFAPGGFVGRAASRAVDARRAPGYPPYDALRFTVPVLETGDVDARVRIRLQEIAQAMSLLRTLIPTLPDGGLVVSIPSRSGEGLGVAEGFRGDCWHWVRLDAGQVAASWARDPSWLHWPLLEAAMQDSVIADFPLVHRSVNASHSGMDL